jgi:hypothetical protein
MFETTPVRERHVAIGVFAAIGLSAMAALYLLLTDGFAPLLPQSASAETPQAPAYVRVLESNWAPPEAVRITPTSYVSNETDAPDYAIEDLDGGENARTPTASAERSYEDITRDINALYEQTSEYREQDYGDAVYGGAAPSADDFVYSADPVVDDAKAEANVSDGGSASPL